MGQEGRKKGRTEKGRKGVKGEGKDREGTNWEREGREKETRLPKLKFLATPLSHCAPTL